ncbi:MAG: biotin--[acetyl-CoA-carboxylase] ligase [Phycisphaerae bacterium]
MQPIRLGETTRHFEQIDSTNTWLLKSAADLPSGTVVTAEFQTAGRGRLGRAWDAAAAQSILMSVLLHVRAGDPLMQHASWLAGVAVVRAIKDATSIRVRLRWPNDLTIDGRKCGGILVETTALPRDACDADDASRLWAVVIGIGINCNQSADSFPSELGAKATSLAIASGRAIERAALTRAVLSELEQTLAAADNAIALAHKREAWIAACDDIGRATVLHRDGESFRGIVRSITGDGDLLVELPGGEVMRFEAAKTTRLWAHESA